jgi:hypothetical protein
MLFHGFFAFRKTVSGIKLHAIATWPQDKKLHMIIFGAGKSREIIE